VETLCPRGVKFLVKFAYSTLVYTGVDFSGEPLEKGLERISKYHYDGVEIVGELTKVNMPKLKELLKSFNLEVSSIGGVFPQGRYLVSSNEKAREAAVEDFRSVVDMASFLGNPVVVVYPSPVGKVYPDNLEKEWGWAVENIRKVGKYAADKGIRLAIEPWNRYETYFLNTLRQALDLMKDVGLDNVGVWGDTFHMNIEERSISAAVEEAKEDLMHLHVADSNRAAPGQGHIDFVPIVKALKKIGYDKYMCFELIPAAADPFFAMKTKKCDEFFDEYTRQSIDYMKTLWSKY